ncbi:MAG: efflux RND transporter periplasmic adaptor subunit [Syntrophomonadaceae bacterium]|nr:efflux RND transporter periplasmic adaptor subunit [Syntrophomonadaceae bacterium]
MKAKKALAAVLILALSLSAYWVYQKYFAENKILLQASGTIEATSVDLNAKVNGSIESINIKEGDSVKKGQLVAELLRNDLAAQKERDTLGVTAAEAKLEDLVSGARAQEIKEAASNVNIARSNYDKATKDLERSEALFKEGAIAQESLDQARLNAELKKNLLAGSEAKLSLLESGSRSALITAARAELERSKAVLKASTALLDDLQVISPLEGIVLSKNYETGEYVAMGAALATVANLNNLWIKVFIPTDDLPAIKLGQKVNIAVSGSDQLFEGVVSEIASQGEFTPKTIQTKKERTNVVFAVKITVNNHDGILKPGMPADVSFDGR